MSFSSCFAISATKLDQPRVVSLTPCRWLTTSVPTYTAPVSTSTMSVPAIAITPAFTSSPPIKLTGGVVRPRKPFVVKPLGFDLVELDDGWRRGWGEWLTNEHFPQGLDAIINSARDRNITLSTSAPPPSLYLGCARGGQGERQGGHQWRLLSFDWSESLSVSWESLLGEAR